MSLRFLTPFTAPPTGFTPANLTSLALWLDANDTSTINSGSPSNTDPVSNWNDKSGNSVNFTQTGANRPTWNTSQINGKPAITFGTNKSLINATNLLSSTSQNFSIFVVSNSVTEATTPIMAELGDTSGLSSYLFFFTSSGGTFIYLGFGGASISTYPLFRAPNIGDFGSNNTWYAVSLTHSAAGAYQFYKSGSSVTTTAGGNSANAQSGSRIGNYVGGDAPSGPIAEFVLMDAVATAGEIANMQTYFNNKYGL